MASQPHQYRKHFSLEEANAMLPLVRAIAQDLSRLSRDVIERRERLSQLRNKRGRGTDVFSEEVQHIEDELEKDGQQLQEYVNELRDLGVEPKNGLEGLIDFPSLMDGRVVYLCWKLGEPEVAHWHEIEAGYRGRQPLFAESADGESTIIDLGSDSDD